MKVEINPENIDWNNDENYFFIHPQQKLNFDLNIFKSLSIEGNLFIITSGTSQKKCVALSKKAFLHSAQSVNQHLQVTKKDKWLVCLPLFHVGGLSILARSFVSGSSYFLLKDRWSPQVFLSFLQKEKITLTSLVPAQVYDLVLNKIKAPSSLRAVVVGGGALHQCLYQSARTLNWPLLPSYGLTEVCSQVATAELYSLNSKNYPSLRILDHCKIKITKSNKIAIQSSSLLTGWIPFQKEWKPLTADRAEKEIFWNSQKFKSSAKKFEKPLKQGWLVTEDHGELSGSDLKVFGRHQMVKIKGKSVSLYELENILVQILIHKGYSGVYQILATPHLRKEYQIDLVTTQGDIQIISRVRKSFNSQVLPFEKIQNCYVVSYLPKNHLSKIHILDLKRELGFEV